MYNIKATIIYNLGISKPRSIPNPVIVRPIDLTPKTRSPYDTDNYQYFTNGPTLNGTFSMGKLYPSEQANLWKKYKEEYPEGQPRHKWLYHSDACNSYSLFRIDISKPGRILCRSTIPTVGCGSVWLYYSENKGDYGNPSMNAIDDIGFPKECYFEIDIFETFREWLGTRVACSGHYGLQTNRKMKTKNIIGCFEGFHYPEVIWDGRGLWIWYFDGIKIFEAVIPQPEFMIYPYLKCTFMAMEPMPEGVEDSSWTLKEIQLSSIIKL